MRRYNSLRMVAASANSSVGRRPLRFFFSQSSEAASHVPGSDASTWTRQLEIPSFLLTTTMLPAAHTEMVTFVLDKMLTQDAESDRYVAVAHHVHGLIMTRLSEAVDAFRHVARWIPHSISPFLDMNSAMYAALPSDEP